MMSPPTLPKTINMPDLQRQIAYFITHLPIKSVLDTSPDIFLIVNNDQRIVFANRRLKEVFASEGVDPRPGLLLRDVLHCVHPVDAADQGKTSGQECQVTDREGRLFDFRVLTQPLSVAGWDLSIITLQDVTQEKRRTLEHIFFHDLLNIAGTMSTLSGLLKEAQGEDDNELKIIVHDLSLRLVEEIHSHRDLLNAENGDLYIRLQPTFTLDILEELRHSYESNTFITGRRVVVEPAVEGEIVRTDPVLLRRVLGNMVKNALEACAKDEVVTLSCRRVGNEVEFTVHNPNPIPANVQPHIFQRSFSTKGEGRGLGTYSMKLLTERYLNGRVSFRSTPEDGTCFTACIPLEFPQQAHDPA